MKIVHIAAGDFFSTYGGGQVYVKNIVNEMIDMGLDICVVSTTGVSHPVLKKFRSCSLYEIPLHISDEELLKIVSFLNPTVIHAHSHKDVVCRIGKQIGVPVVVTAHHGGILCPAGTRLNNKDRICYTEVSHENCLPCKMRELPGGKRLWYPFTRLIPRTLYISIGRWFSNKRFIPMITPLSCSALYIERKREQWADIADKCTCMIAPCKDIKEAMIQNGLSASKVKIVPHGVPMPTIRPPYPLVMDGKVKFYYVGRICYVKGIHVLLDAFHSVDNLQIELHLIGGAANRHERAYMSRLQRSYQNDKRIIWHGKITPAEVYNATANFHVSVVSSYLEVFGLNIAEALALGKPVLTTRCGGGEQQIIDRVNGWLVPTNDAKALADKIRIISNHPEILYEMSKQCCATSVRYHCEQLLKVYDQCITH